MQSSLQPMGEVCGLRPIDEETEVDGEIPCQSSLIVRVDLGP